MVEITEGFVRQEKVSEPRYYISSMTDIIALSEKIISNPEDKDMFIFELKLIDEKQRQKDVLVSKEEFVNKSSEGWYLGILGKVEKIAKKSIVNLVDLQNLLKDLKVFDDLHKKNVTETLIGLASGKDY